MKTWMFIWAFCVLSISGLVSAQGQPVCPAPVLLGFARAASTCYGLEREQACIGSESVSALGFDQSPLTSFAQPGDRINIGDLQNLSLVTVEESIPVLAMTLQASLTDLESRQAALLMVGPGTLVNDAPSMPERSAIAQATANLRAQPRPDGDILARIGVSDSVTVTGRTADSQWLRARLRDTNTIAWVAAEVVTVEGLAALPVVDPADPLYRPFELFTLTTYPTVFCDGALPAGLLLQTPGLDAPIRLTLNQLQVEIAGTAFIRAIHDEPLTLAVLTGQAIVNEAFIPAGAQGIAGTGTIKAEGYDPATFSGLPLTNLPTFIRPAEPLNAAQITELQQAYATALAAETIPTAAPAQLVDNTCRRFVRRTIALSAGPGSFYEAINELQAGSAVTPIFQTTDPQGGVWYQLRGSNWIPAAQVIERGECQPVPVTTNVQAPRTNEFSLETCQTTNGPLRAGQQVTIQFTPPPFDNYADTLNAQQIDPGHITIANQRYRTRATEPILIAGTIGQDDERWRRSFYITWEATPGTFRIEGDRVSYTPICTITVPVS